MTEDNEKRLVDAVEAIAGALFELLDRVSPECDNPSCPVHGSQSVDVAETIKAIKEGRN